MRKLRILIIFIVIVGIVVAAAGFVVKKRAAAGKRPTVVRVEEVQPGELLEFVSAPAELLTLTKTGNPGEIDSQIVAITGATVTSQAVVDIVNTFVVQIKDQMTKKGLIDNVSQ